MRSGSSFALSSARGASRLIAVHPIRAETAALSAGTRRAGVSLGPPAGNGAIFPYPARRGSMTAAPIRIECSMASVASSVARASCGVASVQGRPEAR